MSVFIDLPGVYIRLEHEFCTFGSIEYITNIKLHFKESNYIF